MIFHFSIGSLYAKQIQFISEDELIIQGLLYEEYKAFDRSRVVFGKLYDNTGDKVYLFREVTASLMSKTNINESIKRLKIWDNAHPNTLEVKRLLIPLYLTANDILKAKTEAECLLERSNEVLDLELASNPFLYLGEFQRALSLLGKVYKQTSNEAVLMRMAIIMDEYTDERTQAIQLLEIHRRMNIADNTLYFKLLELYIKENNIDGLLSIYKVLYEEEKDEQYLHKIIDAYAYKGDAYGAIKFLEESGEGKDILYELYKREKFFTKALMLTDVLYKEQKDAKWIAEKGVLTFEKSDNKNDRKMIEKVVSYFEKAIKMGIDDSMYLNYYGYTLIDKEINIPRGIEIIKSALVQQPNNTYYLDSLAWGYYKENKCDKAYATMEIVVKEEGLKEAEIIEHWSMIQKCK